MYIQNKDNAERYAAYYMLLQAAWCPESCSPSLRSVWGMTNPSRGQCFVSAAAAQMKFGGAVYELHLPAGEIHFFNVINGGIVDFTSDQFCREIDADFYAGGILTDVQAKLSSDEKRKRLEVLCSRLAYAALRF